MQFTANFPGMQTSPPPVGRNLPPILQPAPPTPGVGEATGLPRNPITPSVPLPPPHKGSMVVRACAWESIRHAPHPCLPGSLSAGVDVACGVSWITAPSYLPVPASPTVVVECLSARLPAPLDQPTTLSPMRPPLEPVLSEMAWGTLYHHCRPRQQTISSTYTSTAWPAVSVAVWLSATWWPIRRWQFCRFLTPSTIAIEPAYRLQCRGTIGMALLPPSQPAEACLPPPTACEPSPASRFTHQPPPSALRLNPPLAHCPPSMSPPMVMHIRKQCSEVELLRDSKAVSERALLSSPQNVSSATFTYCYPVKIAIAVTSPMLPSPLITPPRTPCSLLTLAPLASLIPPSAPSPKPTSLPPPADPPPPAPMTRTFSSDPHRVIRQKNVAKNYTHCFRCCMAESW